MIARGRLHLLAASLAALALLGAPGWALAGGKCTCKDLRQLLKEAERSRDAYESIFQDELSIQSEAQLNQTWCDRMGLTNCASWGKPGPAGEAGQGGKPPAETPDAGDSKSSDTPKETPDQKKRREANEKCKQNRCDWYCDVAIDTVHEAYHDWYTGLIRSPIFTVRVLVSGMGDGEFIWSEMAREEAAAWQATAKFVADTLAGAEGSPGACDDVKRSPKQKELEERWKNARMHIDDYLENETGRGAADAGTQDPSTNTPSAGTGDGSSSSRGSSADGGVGLPGGVP